MNVNRSSLLLVLWGLAFNCLGASTFSNETSFLGALDSYSTDNYESYPVDCGTNPPGSCSDVSGWSASDPFGDTNVNIQHDATGVSSRTFDDNTATTADDYTVTTTKIDTSGVHTGELIDAIKVSNMPAGRNGNHNTTVGGANFLGFDTNAADVGSNVHVEFVNPINALGFYYIDDDTQNFNITVGGQTYTFGPTGDGGQAYFGIVLNHPITSFDMDAVTDSHWSIDDLTYGLAQVPIPPAALLFASSLGLLGFVVRRKQLG